MFSVQLSAVDVTMPSHLVSTLQYLQGFAERFNSFDELVVNGNALVGVHDGGDVERRCSCDWDLPGYFSASSRCLGPGSRQCL
jgi:hypothetical protein